MIITGATTVATGGTLIASFLGVDYIIGAIIMALLNMCIAVFGVEMIRKSSTYMTFGIIAMMVVLVVITVATKGRELVEFLGSDWYPPTGGRSWGNGAWRVLSSPAPPAPGRWASAPSPRRCRPRRPARPAASPPAYSALSPSS